MVQVRNKYVGQVVQDGRLEACGFGGLDDQVECAGVRQPDRLSMGKVVARSALLDNGLLDLLAKVARRYVVEAWARQGILDYLIGHHAVVTGERNADF